MGDFRAGATSGSAGEARDAAPEPRLPGAVRVSSRWRVGHEQEAQGEFRTRREVPFHIESHPVRADLACLRFTIDQLCFRFAILGQGVQHEIEFFVQHPDALCDRSRLLLQQQQSLLETCIDIKQSCTDTDPGTTFDLVTIQPIMELTVADDFVTDVCRFNDPE